MTPASGAAGTMPQLLLQASGSLLGVPLAAVERVLPLTAWREVPDTPVWFQGLLNLGGEVIPVVDLAQRLGLGEPWPYQLETPLVILQHTGRRVAVVVDEVLGVQEVQDSPPQQGELFGQTAPPFLGVVRTRAGRLALVLDPAPLVRVNLGLDPDLLHVDERFLAAWRQTGST